MLEFLGISGAPALGRYTLDNGPARFRATFRRPLFLERAMRSTRAHANTGLGLLSVCIASATAVYEDKVHALDGCPPLFSLELFEHPPCGFPRSVPNSLSWAINNDGLVAGYFTYDICDPSAKNKAFLWSPEIGFQSIPYPAPGCKETRFYGLNDLGIAVGDMEDFGPGWTGSKLTACMYVDGQFIDLGTGPGGNRSVAHDINNNNVIVGNWGNFFTGPNIQACRWEDGALIDMMAEMGTPSADCRAINDSGQIVGWRGTGPARHAFLWENGMVTALPELPGWTRSEATAISENGIIAGNYRYFDRVEGEILDRACAWINGEAIELGVLPGNKESFAYGVNSFGDIVGAMNIGPSRPFLWRHGVLHDVEQCLDGRTIGLSSTSRAINESGWILATSTPAGCRLQALVSPADLDCDLDVDGGDLGLFLGEWNHTESAADLNMDGLVDGADLGVLLGQWTG